LARAWEDWAHVDPYYAVLADPTKWGGAWVPDSEEFFRSGEAEVKLLIEQVGKLELPRSWERALDFGCGLGRVTHALGPHFDRVLGVDLSPTMVAQAGLLHEQLSNVEFRQVRDPRDLCAERYDLVWSVLVLQHLGSTQAIAGAVRGLASLLVPDGLLVVEIPDRVPSLGWRGHLRVRTRLYDALRSAGLSPTPLHRRLHLSPPMTMNALAEDRVRAELTGSGAEVVMVTRHDGTDGVDYRRYFATQRPGLR
jgi:SAM-dependent methyltransferase